MHIHENNATSKHHLKIMHCLDLTQFHAIIVNMYIFKMFNKIKRYRSDGFLSMFNFFNTLILKKSPFRMWLLVILTIHRASNISGLHRLSKLEDNLTYWNLLWFLSKTTKITHLSKIFITYNKIVCDNFNPQWL